MQAQKQSKTYRESSQELNDITAATLIKWSQWHALFLLLFSLIIIFVFPLAILIVISSFSFAVLIFSQRRQWTPGRQFGWANVTTLIRLQLVQIMLLPIAYQNDLIIYLATWIFILDSVDGWLARHLHVCSEFGEYFDKETDAYFILVLCLLLYLNQRIDWWILFPGLLRYIFVLLLMISPVRIRKETKSYFGKAIFAGSVCVLIFCFSPYQHIYLPLAKGMTALLSFSFALSLWQIFSPVNSAKA